MSKTLTSSEQQSPQAHATLAQAASQLGSWAAIETDPAAFLRQALPLISQTLGSEYVAVVRGVKGRWRTIAAAGPERTPPDELLAGVIDGDRPLARGDWHAAPLAPQSVSGELLVA